MFQNSSLSMSEAIYIEALAYKKAWAWVNQWNHPMFSITTGSVTRAFGGWIVNGTMSIPGFPSIVGYSVFCKRKAVNGRLAGEPIVIIYGTDLI